MTFRNYKSWFIIFVIIVQILSEFHSKPQDNYGIRFKSVKCQSDNKTIMVKYCYLKAVSRKIVTFNVGLKYLIPHIKPLYLHAIFYYRYGTIFRQIIDLKKLEVCAILDGADTNPLIKLIIDMVKRKAPKMIHKCPYTGDFDLRNFTVDLDLIDKATMFFTEGTYRLDISFFFNDTKSLNVTGMAEIRSPLKESFG